MISIIVPIYNEEEIIDELVQRLANTLDRVNETSEVIFINDGSTDSSLQKIKQKHMEDNRFQCISLSRNFGHQKAISAGLKYASGDAVVLIDGDLQDPPELVMELMNKWKEGYQVVYAIRTKRKESLCKKFFYFLYYRMLHFLANINIPVDSGDFCLIDRQIVDIMNSLPEKNRFIRGLRSWVGFRQVGIPYSRDNRFAGKSKYSVIKLVKLGFDGIFSFSNVPLRISIIAGTIISGASLLFGAYVVLNYITGTQRLFMNFSPGWASLIVSITFLGGVQLFSIGILGEYIGRIFSEAKRRPEFIVQEFIGIQHNGSS